MIVSLNDFSRIDEFELPFIPYIPWDLASEEISIRTADSRWPTLRYLVHFLGHRFRVKQFFMDWFFTGFPKALMSSFADAYSPVEFSMEGAYQIYTGLNYRGNIAASIYSHGTEIEIEGAGSISHEIFRSLAADHLVPAGQVAGKVANLQFPERSFFARGNPAQWYEEERIRRLHWTLSPHGEALRFGDVMLKASGLGVLRLGEGGHGIALFQRDQYMDVAWLEFASENIEIRYPYYRLRKGSGFLEKLSRIGGWTVVGMHGTGPLVAQENANGTILTVSATPGIAAQFQASLPEIENMLMRKFSPYLGKG